MSGERIAGGPHPQPRRAGRQGSRRRREGKETPFGCSACTAGKSSAVIGEAAVLQWSVRATGQVGMVSSRVMVGSCASFAGEEIAAISQCRQSTTPDGETNGCSPWARNQIAVPTNNGNANAVGKVAMVTGPNGPAAEQFD